MVTPFVADTVLTKKGSRNKKHYEKLPDGLYADDDLKEQWGKIIQARIDQNFSMSMGAQCMRDNPSKPRAEDHRFPQRKRGWKTYWGGGGGGGGGLNISSHWRIPGTSDGGSPPRW